MSNIINKRFSTWWRIMKSSRIIKTQEELGSNLVNRKGENISQAFISNIIRNRSPLGDGVLSSLEDNFPFTTSVYFLYGTEDIVNLKKLFKYLLVKHELTQKDFVLKCGIEELSEVKLSKMNNKTEINEWQEVFGWFNVNHDYSINVNRMLKYSTEDKKKFKGKTAQVERFIELVAYLKKMNTVKSDKDFAESINVSPSMISNMLNENARQDVTKDMLVSISKKYPFVNLRWILLGEGGIINDLGANNQVILKQIWQGVQELHIMVKSN